MTVTTLVEIIWIVAAVGLIIFVLLHSPKGDGIGGIGGQAQLFTSTKSAEKTLNRITWTLAIAFMSMTVILSANWLPQAKPEAPAIAPPASNTAPTSIPSDLTPSPVPPSETTP